jgi:hypothetical protein
LTDEPVMEVWMVQLILLVFAFVLALLEAIRPYIFTAPTLRRPHLGWLAVTFYLLSLLTGHF